MNREKVLVTGGMGFIGKFLERKILNETDYNITIVDNLSSSVLDEKIANDKRVQFIEEDFSEWALPDNEKYFQIYHLASPVGPVGVLKYKGKIGKIIIEQTYKVAEIAIKMGAKLIDISTSEVYGKNPDDENEGQREDINKVVPPNITVRLEYGVSKLLSEIMLKNLSIDFPLKYNCIRPFNIIGPSQNDELGFVMPRFLRQALSGEPITIYGDGKQKRTFTHVEDLVDGIFMVMESDITGEIFNIGNPRNVISIRELAEKIKEATNSYSEINLVNPKKLFGDEFAEAWNKIPNVDKLVKAVGWKPNWSIDDIISEAAILKQRYLIKT